MAQPILWAGIDAGKAAHHCVAIDADGQRVLSRRVVNDEAALIDLIRAVKELAGGGSVRWAIDLNSGGAALLITLLLDDGQDLLYIPGRTGHHASGAARPTPRTQGSSPTKHECAKTSTSSVTVTKLQWISGYYAHAAMTSHRIGTGQSTVCALSCWSISPPWNGLSTSHTAKARSFC
jgi:Transposase